MRSRFVEALLLLLRAWAGLDWQAVIGGRVLACLPGEPLDVQLGST
jgi:hypothetical protein